ncbi:MAG: DUF5682 family protein [Stenotrophomonas maltophilia]
MSDQPDIIGVRHHSPACARLVAARIRRQRPAFVLIEGPADFNPRLDELHLDHRLPLAIYSHRSDDSTHHGSWTPFAEHSPEWQALVVGREVGAQVRFIDLPAWHEAFAALENRYADSADHAHEARADAYERALGERLAVQGRDALWDHLFEQDDVDEGLHERLHTYFVHLRGDDRGSLGNQQREQMMAAWIAWAMRQPPGEGRHGVLVVCGGYHAPALQQLWAQQPSASTPPAVPLPAAGSSGAVRHGSFLVPYTFKRLDAFAGYASGMPSPGWYQWQWEHGADADAHMLGQVMARLRGRGLPASTADLIAARLRADGLARLRGHPRPQRVDWLDALAGALVKDALDAPLPWTYRGRLRAGTDPVLVQIMEVLAGDSAGLLDPLTPQPPLLADLAAQLHAHGLVLGQGCRLDLLDPHDRQRSVLLHRLLLLQVPGIVRTHGPAQAISDTFEETWSLAQPVEQHAALIEAGAWGATVGDAARARLEDALRHADRGIAGRVPLLNRAAWAALPAVSAAVLDDLAAAVASEARFEVLAPALGELDLLRRHGHMLGMQEAPMLNALLGPGLDRALWLLEAPGQVGSADTDAHLRGHLALRQILTGRLADDEHGDPAALAIAPARALAVWQRKLANPQAAAVSRGASLGALVGLRERVGVATTSFADEAMALLQGLAPAHVGDALAGLLALARDRLASEPAFTAALDGLIQALQAEDFILALPALRGAFAWLPARERGALATRMLALHGAAHLSGRVLTAPVPGQASADALARATQRETTALDALARWGITPVQEAAP